MFKTLFLATIISLAIYAPAVEAAVNCLSVNVRDQALYNLCPFSRHNGPYQAELKETGQVVDGQPTVPVTLFKMSFSLPNPKVPACDGGNAIYASHLDEKNKNAQGQPKCYELAKAKPRFDLIKADNDTVGIQVNYDNPKAKEEKDAYDVVINIFCDKTISDEAETQFHISKKTDNLIVIEGNSPFGCPYISVGVVETVVDSHVWIFFAILILAGLFLLVLGVSMFKYAMFLITSVAVTIGLGVLFFTFINAETPKFVLWVVLVVCIIIGLGVGYVAVRYKKYGFLGIGVAAGIFGGIFICGFIASWFGGDNTQEKKGTTEWFYYVIIAIFGAIGGFLMYRLRKNVTIICTSFLGSYLIVRSLSLFGKHFPNEISLFRRSAEFDLWSYCYFALIFVISVAGIYVQHLIKKKREDEEEKINNLAYSKAPEGDVETAA